MASNKIEIYQQNTATILCVVVGIDDVSGYIPYLTIKKNSIETIPVLTNTGFVTDPSGSLLFNFSQTDTSLASGDYVYDVTIEKAPHIYTIVKDVFTILDGVRY